MLKRRRPTSWMARVAGVWSFGYAGLATFWALGGGGFPFGEGDAEAGDMGSLFVGATAATMAPAVVVLCCIAGAASLALARPDWRFAPRGVVLGLAWSMAGLLVLVVPDVRLMRDLGYLMAGGRGFVEKFDWPAANQLLCLTGGLVWARAAVEYQRRTGAARVRRREVGVAEEQRWAGWGRALTLAAILLPVPYELTRWAWAFGWPVGVSQGAEIIEGWSGAERLGMFVMGGLPLVGGLLTHGLSQRWGEEFPRWLPRVGGRAVPIAMVVVPAGVVAIVIVTAATSLLRISVNEALGRTPAADPDIEGWAAWAPGILWMPWGLALAGATYAYWRRRRARSAAMRRLEPPAARAAIARVRARRR